MPHAAPLVSIGLPVRNGDAYLAEALEDLLGQTFADLEVVVCDNASTDDTGAIVRAAARRDPRVRYHRNTIDVGALPNANLAFRMSRGRYFALAAHDDRHAPDFLARLVAALEAQPEAVLAYGRKGLIDDHGRPFRFDPARGLHVVGQRAVDYDGALERPLPDDPVARYRLALASNDCNAPIHGLFRRDALARLPEHGLHGSDRLIVAAAALWGPFAFVDAELMQYRVHAGSTRYLDRPARLAREAGREDAQQVTDPVATFLRYLKAVEAAPLSPGQRVRAYAATVASLTHRRVLRSAFLPGPHSYWGWRRWPWAPEEGRTRGSRAGGRHQRFSQHAS